MPYPHLEPLFLRQTTADPSLHRRCSNTVCLHLCGVPGSWCAQGFLEPSEHLWRERDLILNANSPILLSYWGFSFALRHGVSPLSRSSLQHTFQTWNSSQKARSVSKLNRRAALREQNQGQSDGPPKDLHGQQRRITAPFKQRKSCARPFCPECSQMFLFQIGDSVAVNTVPASLMFI